VQILSDGVDAGRGAAAAQLEAGLAVQQELRM